MNNRSIGDYLEMLGYSQEKARIYQALIEFGQLTVLQLSRTLLIERTRIYRQIEEMLREGLIEEILAFKTRKYKAADLDKIKLLVEQRRSEANSLIKTFPEFSQLVNSVQSKNNPTKVLYYQGKTGIEQMLWNSLRAKKELRSYVNSSFQGVIGQKRFNKWAEAAINSGVTLKEIRSPIFLSTVYIKALKFVDLGSKYFWRNAPKELKITHSMDIYNDVVAIYFWKNDEIFGVEIYNSLINEMQKSIFEVFWKLSKKPKLK